MGRKKKKPATSNLQSFSANQTAGGSSQSCPFKKKTKPCNLSLLRLTEPSADMSGKKGQRIVEIRQGQALRRGASPTLMDSGDTFQITAQSAENPPRTIKMQVTTQAVCSGATHAELAVMDGKGSRSQVGTQANLRYSRDPMSTDSGLPGLWVILNAACRQTPASYPLSTTTCGVPASGPPVPSLAAVIQVYPADVYEFELALPAILKPNSLSFEAKNKGWKTTKDENDEEIKKAGDAASEEYKKSEALRSVGSEGEFRDFFEDLKKKQLGVEDPKYADEITIKLTQTDGERKLEAPVDDILKLVHAISSAEYAFKQIQDWIENFQVGPGVSLKLECQFFAGRVNAKWGYTEYLDDRVFFAWAGAIKIDLIKASVEVNAGWKCGGLADAFVFLKGDGTISLNVPAIAKEDPDEAPKASVKPEGELKLSVGVQGAAGWCITGSYSAEVTFKADTEDFKVFSQQHMFGGTITISREPAEGVFTMTCRLFGGSTSKTSKIKFAKGNPKLAEFELS